MMKRFLARLKRDERGLTLVELLAVIVILAIVGGIATVSIGGVIENSKKDAHVANALQLISATKLYEATTGKSVDATGVTLKKLKEEKLLDDVKDPWQKASYKEDDSKVVKDGSDYKATLKTDNAVDCDIEDKKEADLLKGREACTVSTTP